MGMQGSPTSILRKYLYRECRHVFVGIVYLVFGQTATFAVPLLIGQVVDQMTNQGGKDKTNFYCLVMLGIVLISALAVWGRAFTFNCMSERMAYHIRYDLFMHVTTKDIGFFDKNKTGDILSRMSADVAVVQSGLGTNISMLVRSMITIIACLVIMIAISWQLTLVSLTAIFTILIVAALYAIKAKTISRDKQARTGEMG